MHSLFKNFSPEQLELGARCVERRNVVNIYWETPKQLAGTVRDSKDKCYKVAVVIDSVSGTVSSTSCNCKLRNNCHHAVALLITAGKDPDALDPAELDSHTYTLHPHHPLWKLFFGTQAAPEKMLPQRVTLHRDDSILELSNQKDKALSALVWINRAEEVAKRKQSTLDIRFLLKNDEPGELPKLQAFLCTIKHSGEVSFESITPASERWSKSSTLHQQIGFLWKQLRSLEPGKELDYAKSYAYSVMFEFLIRTCIKTGKCFFGTLDSQPLSFGPQLDGKLSWKKTGALFEPRIYAQTSKGEPVETLTWCLPWYLNGSELGLVRVERQLPSIRAWLRLPSLTRDECAAAISRLNDLHLSEIFPLPPAPTDTGFELHSTIKPRLTIRQVPNDGGVNVRTLFVQYPTKTAVAYTVRGKTVIRQVNPAHVKKLVAFMTTKLKCRHVTADIRLRQRHLPNSEYAFQLTDERQWGLFNPSTVNLLAKSFKIRTADRELLLPLHLDEKSISIDLTEGARGWFSMELKIKIGDESFSLSPILRRALEALPELTEEEIDKLNLQGRFVCSLDNNRVITMPFTRIRTILMTLRELLLGTADDSIQVSGLDVAQLFENDAELSRAQLNLPVSVTELMHAKKMLALPGEATLPKSFQAELRPYQVDGFNWLQHISALSVGGILADDMGLGKTVQVLASVLADKQLKEDEGPALVVCPKTLVPNWLSEAANFAPTLKVISYTGQKRRNLASQIKAADVVLINYDLLVRDKELLERIDWRGVILDEAQKIKNHATKTAKAAKSLPSKYRLCLTGTPVENSLGDLWSLFDFVVPGMLGSERFFKDHYRTPIEEESSKTKRRELTERIGAFLLRRTKRLVLPELPEKIEITRLVELSPEQTDLYETVRLLCHGELKQEIKDRGFAKCKFQQLPWFLKLRQICLHTSLTKLEEAKKITETSAASSKIECLLEMVEQLISEDRRMLIFSQFTGVLDLIAKELDNREIRYVQLRGDTPDKAEPVEMFKHSDIPVFMLTKGAGGSGLNLTAADVVILFDPWWNPAVEDQASDRAYRFGQLKNVFVYKLIARGSIEQRIIELQERKRRISESIYSDSGELANLSEEDLWDLLRPIDSGKS